MTGKDLALQFSKVPDGCIASDAMNYSINHFSSAWHNFLNSFYFLSQDKGMQHLTWKENPSI